MIKEMCKFSNLSSSNNQKKSSGNGTIVRVNGGLQSSSKATTTKPVVEDIDIHLDGDEGTGGRPRVREEIKLPPNYSEIDLNDPNDPVLFQGELCKFKAGYNPTFINRWVQVTEKSLKYFKGRCNAVTCCNKPLLSIPVAAIRRVERVNFDLHFKKTEQEKNAPLLNN